MDRPYYYIGILRIVKGLLPRLRKKSFKVLRLFRRGRPAGTARRAPAPAGGRKRALSLHLPAEEMRGRAGELFLALAAAALLFLR